MLHPHSRKQHAPFSNFASNLYTDADTFPLNVTVTDINNNTASGEATADVQPALITLIANPISATLNESYTGTLATFTFAGSQALPSFFTATIDWGDRGDNQNSAGTVTLNSDGSYSISGTHTYASSGSDTVTISLSDTAGDIASASTDADIGVLQVTANAINTTQNQSYNAVVASFTSPNLSLAAGDFTATIDWGDGTTPSSGTITADPSGAFDVSAQHSYASVGVDTLTVTITDATDTTSDTADVNVIAPSLDLTDDDITATQGQLFTGTVASFTSPDPNAVASDFTALVTWGDGNTSSGTVSTDPNGGFDVTASNTYTNAGNFPLSISLQDTSGRQTGGLASATVNAAAFTLTADNITATLNLPFSGTVASFTSPIAGAQPVAFTVSIVWGDGTTSPGTAYSTSNDTYDVDASHTYSTTGTFTLSVTVVDPNNNSLTSTASAVVSPAVLPVTAFDFTANVNVAYTGVIASFFAANPYAQPSDFTVSIDWGDLQSSSGMVTPAPTGGFDLTGTHTYAAIGVYTVSISVSDSTGAGSATCTATVQGGVQGSMFVGGGGITTDDQVQPGQDASLPPAMLPVLSGGDLVQTSSSDYGGNPALNGFSSVTPVRYADGAVAITATDLSSSGFGTPWGQTRTWTNSPTYATDSLNGNGEVSTQLPYLLEANDEATIVAITGGLNARYFDANSNGVYVPRFFLQDQLTFSPSAGQFTLTDTSGDQLVFNGFSTTLPAQERGRLVSYADPYGNQITVPSWNADGTPHEVQRSANGVTESYLYSYVPNQGLLFSVVLRRSTNGGRSWTIVRQVAYSYYGATDPYGNPGDLKLVQLKNDLGQVRVSVTFVGGFAFYAAICACFLDGM